MRRFINKTWNVTNGGLFHNAYWNLYPIHHPMVFHLEYHISVTRVTGSRTVNKLSNLLLGRQINYSYLPALGICIDLHYYHAFVIVVWFLDHHQEITICQFEMGLFQWNHNEFFVWTICEVVCKSFQRNRHFTIIARKS